MTQALQLELNNKEVKKLLRKQVTLKIEQDHDYESPREWDNMGTMMCKHRDYNLGDTSITKEFPNHEFETWEEILKHLIKEGARVIMPLFLYEHSGISISTGRTCTWDSGQVGFIYVTADRIRKELNIKRITKKVLKKVYTILNSEVEVYDDYLRGNCYGYTLMDNLTEEEHDSCWGFFGSDRKELIKDMKDNISELHYNITDIVVEGD